jgi:hypothetical protein
VSAVYHDFQKLSNTAKPFGEEGEGQKGKVLDADSLSNATAFPDFFVEYAVKRRCAKSC